MNFKKKKSTLPPSSSRKSIKAKHAKLVKNNTKYLNTKQKIVNSSFFKTYRKK